MSFGDAADGGSFLQRKMSMSETSFVQGGDYPSAPSPPARPVTRSLTRHNSITETKTLFAHCAARSASFSEPSQFSFDSHFEWLERLGSEPSFRTGGNCALESNHRPWTHLPAGGSFADVYAVKHKIRPDERYAVKVLKRQFRSKTERAAYLQEAELASTIPAHPHVVVYYRAWQDDQIMCACGERSGWANVRAGGLVCGVSEYSLAPIACTRRAALYVLLE